MAFVKEFISEADRENIGWMIIKRMLTVGVGLLIERVIAFFYT